MESDRYYGSLTKNSLKFPRAYADGIDTFEMESIKVTLQNQTIEGMAVDESNSFLDHYVRLFQNLNMIGGGNKCAAITFEEFKNSCNVLVFDFSASLNKAQSDLLPLVRSGHLRIEILLTRPSTVPLTVLTFLEIPSMLMIDHEGRIKLDSL